MAEGGGREGTGRERGNCVLRSAVLNPAGGNGCCLSCTSASAAEWAGTGLGSAGVHTATVYMYDDAQPFVVGDGSPLRLDLLVTFN
jgi:hypothetical protein